MTYLEMIEKAKKNIGPFCKACAICNGFACKNQIPGPGAKGNGDNAIRNYKAWQNYRLLQNPISDVQDSDTTFHLFNQTLNSPIMAGPIGDVKKHYGSLYTDLEYNKILLNGCEKASIVGFTGDGLDKQIMKNSASVIRELNGRGIPTIKPWDIKTVFEKLDLVKASNPYAIAMDIDACGLPFLKNQNPPAGTKTIDDLKKIIEYAKTPFIVKGIMSENAALSALEAGASAIVVSNHGGRVLESSASTASVLEKIALKVKGRMKIFVDGGIRSGVDIFKALALGADAVLIARPFATAIYGDNEEGVKLLADKLTTELKDAMLQCGAKDLQSISKDMITFEQL